MKHRPFSEGHLCQCEDDIIFRAMGNHSENSWPSNGALQAGDHTPEDPERDNQASRLCSAVRRSKCHFFFFNLATGRDPRKIRFVLICLRKRDLKTLDLKMTF